MEHRKPFSTGKIVGLVLLGVLIVMVLWFMGTYNSLVSSRVNVEEKQSDIEVQYQRRFDLIPNLEAAVKGIFNQEKTIFTALAEARTRYAGAEKGTSEKLEAIRGYDTALSRLLVVVENYPNLKSAEQVQTLMVQIEGTENRIQVARNNYNAVVTTYNKKVQFFPSNIVAGIFGFQERKFFQATEEAKVTVPRVDLSTQ